MQSDRLVAAGAPLGLGSSLPNRADRVLRDLQRRHRRLEVLDGELPIRTKLGHLALVVRHGRARSFRTLFEERASFVTPGLTWLVLPS